MKIILDNAPWGNDIMYNLTREEIYEMLLEEVASRERYILDVVSDGESMSEQDFLTIPDDVEVHVTTASRDEIFLEVLQEIEHSLAQADQNITQLIQNLRNWNSYEHDPILQASDQIKWIQAAISSLELTLNDPDIDFPDPQLLQDQIEKVSWLIEQGSLAEASMWHEIEWPREKDQFLQKIKKIQNLFKDETQTTQQR